MALVNKIDSNCTGLRYSEELSIGVVDPSAVWLPLEPNSYPDFGGEVILKSRNPINSGRQRKKGTLVDVNSTGGLNTDLTQNNLEDLLQGFFFADARTKAEFGGAGEITNVDGITEDYDAASGLGIFAAGDLIIASAFSTAANNGLKTVTAAIATAVTVAEDLTAEASPPAAANLVTVGFQFAAGDLDVSAPGGAFPTLTTTVKDMTELGIIPGEWIFIGGDLAALAFSTAANNGFARVRSIAANVMTLDKTQDTMVTEASTTETVQIFLGRVLVNEKTKALQKRRSYQLERELGANDDAAPTQVQSEYVVGAVPNELTFNFNQADLITADLTFMATDHETRTGVQGFKAGTRPTLLDADAYNTSDDFTRLKMSLTSTTDSNPTKLFAFLTEFTISINNNLSMNKAVSVIGAFDISAGTFEIGGTSTAYFSDVAAIASIRSNSDVTIDFAIVKDNEGIVVDIPRISLGDGRLNVEQDEPIQMPLTMPAAEDDTFGHTLLMVFFDFLPTAAE